MASSTTALDGPDIDLTSEATAPPSPWPFPNTASQTAAPPPQEQLTMPKQPAGKPATREAAKPRVTRASGTQFRVACVLLAAGAEGLDRDSIAAQLDGVATKALSNALGNMKVAGRVEHPGGQRWRLTAAGRDWVNGGRNLRKQRAAPAARRAVTPVSNVQLVPVRPSFRCYVASDGCFAVEKAGQKIELTLEETRQMVRYLDLVGEQLIEAAAHAGLSPSLGEANEQRH